MDNYEFQAFASQLAIAVCRGEITAEQAIAQQVAVQPCVMRNHTCIAHGNNSNSCKEETE